MPILVVPADPALSRLSQFLLELMGAMPSNSVLLVVTDHGHEAAGGAGGTSETVTKLPMYVYRKTVAFGASALELEALAAAATFSTTPGHSTDSDPRALLDIECSMLDLAPTLALLSGLPLPRHAEGGFITRMFSNVRREMWPAHARDLLYQRWHAANAIIEYEQLDRDGRLRDLQDIEQDTTAKIATGGGTPLEQGTGGGGGTHSVPYPLALPLAIHPSVLFAPATPFLWLVTLTPTPTQPCSCRLARGGRRGSRSLARH